MLGRNMRNVDIFLILDELTDHKVVNWSCNSEEINQRYSVIEKVGTIILLKEISNACHCF